MRPLVATAGVIVFLVGSGFALQGAYLLPATFMRGPAWIGIGAAIALAGAAIAIVGIRPGARFRRPPTVPSQGDEKTD